MTGGTDGQAPTPRGEHGWVNGIVRTFLRSNLPIILIVLSVAMGATALVLTPREEEPQIVVPLADVYVSFPGHSPEEVERLVATPLENILSNIDGVEYVYSMSRQDQAIITVRYYVGQDRERSLVKLYKKIDENVDMVPPGVIGWVVKPVEIDDVPILTLALTEAPGAHVRPYALRRAGEEVVQRLLTVADISRAYVVGGQPRVCHVWLDADRMSGYHVSTGDIERAIRGANVAVTSGQFDRDDRAYTVQAGRALSSAAQLGELVVRVADQRPVFLKDVADIEDGPDELASYVRHGFGPGATFEPQGGRPGTPVGSAAQAGAQQAPSRQAVTIAIAKKKGANAATVAGQVLIAAEGLKRDVIPDDMQLVITRNDAQSSDEKVNDLIEALAVALMLAVVVLTVGLGWREALIVALAVPVVFGLTLSVNLLAGLTINRVTLFALILSLGLLVDDPIVDVENIARHFRLRGRASRQIVLEAVSEIRPPLIAATLAVIASFLPMLFITGMMGPYMKPMALNVPVTMLMSMAVAFTITPWLAYHLLKGRRSKAPGGAAAPADDGDPHSLGRISQTLPYRAFRPIVSPLLSKPWLAWTFLALIGAATLGAASMALARLVPLKMLPYGNKDQFQLVLDFDEGTTLERADAAVRRFEDYLRTVPEVADYTAYVGLAGPIDFNGMVRHYYLRSGPNVADIQVNLVGRKARKDQTHAVALRLRDELSRLAATGAESGLRLKIVEPPPGPPVLSSVVAEVYGRPDSTYQDIIDAAQTVAERLAREPGVADVDTMIEHTQTKLVYVADQEKAALSGLRADDLAATLQAALSGSTVGTLHAPDERNPLRIEMRLPRPARSSQADLERLHVKGADGSLVSLAELGHWEQATVGQTIYHKDLRRVMYVLGESVGRPPAEIVMDVRADQGRSLIDGPGFDRVGSGYIERVRPPLSPRPTEGRSFFRSGGDLPWGVPAGMQVDFAGEGEWQITLQVFRDMGLAFIAALVAIYILLVAQTGSFVIPVVVMMSIPLTILGIMPGFWLLNKLSAGSVGGYANPVFFTATGMIGMIALAGIVTRGAIIIVDFIHLSLARGRSLFDAIIESCVVRLRPILLTACVAMLSALPIATDPIFSGLAWALIFGLLASTAFTLLVIPVVYWLLYRNRPGHGYRRQEE